jgi:hypothetical protein
MGASTCVAIARGASGCKVSTQAEEPLDVYVPETVDGGADVTVLPAVEGGTEVVDRAGHPLVAVMLMPVQLDDQYNAVSSFDPAMPRTLQDAIEARLVELDTLALTPDGGPDPVDWSVPEGGVHPLQPAFVADSLLVDTALPCVGADGGFVTSYFDVDREVYLGNSVHTTCGGRSPGEDVVSETLTLLVTGGRAPVSQGVAGPTKAAGMAFPYLAPPN